MDLQITVRTEERLVQSFKEIGLKWKEDGSVETACKVNDIINGYFEEYQEYEFYMENKIMEQFNLKYAASTDMINISIARMVVKNELILAKPLISGQIQPIVK